MGEQTNIEWCDATLNLWWGCTKVSQGCKNCYAENLSDQRFGKGAWGPSGTRQEVKSWRTTLNKISKRAKAENRRLKVFCQSMSDTFEGPETMGGVNSENWKLVSRLREELLKAIDEHLELDFLVLTKRPENIELYGPPLLDWVPPNLWLGTSVEDQETANARIPLLLNVPAAVRFLSMEPLLGPVELKDYFYADCDHCEGLGGYYPSDPQEEEDCPRCEGFCKDKDELLEEIHWVIVGGESGPGARPMHPDWVRSLRDQCKEAGVPFFFKQWGGVNKKSAGRILDDVEHNEFPEVQS